MSAEPITGKYIIHCARCIAVWDENAAKAIWAQEKGRAMYAGNEPSPDSGKPWRQAMNPRMLDLIHALEEGGAYPDEVSVDTVSAVREIAA